MALFSVKHRLFCSNVCCNILRYVNYSTDGSVNLKSILSNLVASEQKKMKQFRESFGSTIVSEVTVDMMYGGMQGMKGLVTETSVLDPEKGIHFRGLSIPDIKKQLPKATPHGEEPLPEGLFFLLLTGQVPSSEQVAWISHEWASRADLPTHVVTMLNNFPKNLHPMTQFTSAVAALDTDSHFADAYRRGSSRSSLWEHLYEDAMDLIAKIPTVAAAIYRNLYRDGSLVGVINIEKDWSYNFASMLGFEDCEFTELLRLYLTTHADHEGGNVCAHACHLVGSALTNPYLAFSAGLAGLAGPLHGLANQEALRWLMELCENIGLEPSKDQILMYCEKRLLDGLLIPGYGHSVLRRTDPRYIAQRQFALKYMPKDAMFRLVEELYGIVPDLLRKHYPTVNPWPNADANSGCLLQFYGLKECNFYTVLFGVSRALGVMASLVWDRILGLPIEHPKSFTTDKLIEIVTRSQGVNKA